MADGSTRSLDLGYERRPVTKTDQVRLIGNSVCPDMAEVANDLAPLIALYAGAAA